MTGKNKNDKDIEKQNEKLEQILDKLTSLESQINDLKSENKSLKDTHGNKRRQPMAHTESSFSRKERQ